MDGFEKFSKKNKHDEFEDEFYKSAKKKEKIKRSESMFDKRLDSDNEPKDEGWDGKNG